MDGSDQGHHLVHVGPDPKEVHATGREPDNNQGKPDGFASSDVFCLLGEDHGTNERGEYAEYRKDNCAGDDPGCEKSVRFDGHANTG